MREPREEVLPLADWLRLPPPDIMDNWRCAMSETVLQGERLPTVM